MVMVRSCVLLSKAPTSVIIVLGIKGEQTRKYIEIYSPVDTSKTTDGFITLYLMRTVFVSDVLVPCFSEIFESLDGLSCCGVAVGVEVSESEIAPAHMLTLAARGRAPVILRVWTMLLRRLSSPSISFLTNKQGGVWSFNKLYIINNCFLLYVL